MNERGERVNGNALTVEQWDNRMVATRGINELQKERSDGNKRSNLKFDGGRGGRFFFLKSFFSFHYL